MKQRREMSGRHRGAEAAGDAARARIGTGAYDLNVQQYCCGGLNFGYFYDALADHRL